MEGKYRCASSETHLFFIHFPSTAHLFLPNRWAFFILRIASGTARSYADRAFLHIYPAIAYTVWRAGELSIQRNYIMGLLTDVLADAFTDTIKLVPFLLVTYLVMEYLERKTQDKSTDMLARVGRFGPLFGGAVGAVPQCGFSAAASRQVFSALRLAYSSCLRFFSAWRRAVSSLRRAFSLSSD